MLHVHRGEYWEIWKIAEVKRREVMPRRKLKKQKEEKYEKEEMIQDGEEFNLKGGKRQQMVMERGGLLRNEKDEVKKDLGGLMT